MLRAATLYVSWPHNLWYRFLSVCYTLHVNAPWSGTIAQPWEQAAAFPSAAPCACALSVGDARRRCPTLLRRFLADLERNAIPQVLTSFLKADLATLAHVLHPNHVSKFKVRFHVECAVYAAEQYAMPSLPRCPFRRTSNSGRR